MNEKAENSAEWNEDVLAKLRQVLHVYDVDEMKSILLKYSEMIEVFDINYPNWPVLNKVDWAGSCALAPEWFGDLLTTRINNTMLVSALLITVTTALLLYPPSYGLPEFNESSDGPNHIITRAFFYICSISNLMFTVSIILGVTFIENGMSRTYTEADKMVLISKFYNVLLLCQLLSRIGAYLFIPALLIPTFQVFDYEDAMIMTLVTTIASVPVLCLHVYMDLQCTKCQGRQSRLLLTIVNPVTGRLKGEYYPPNAGMSQEQFRKMYLHMCDNPAPTAATSAVAPTTAPSP